MSVTALGGEETGHFFMHTIFISLWDVTANQYTFLRIFGLNIRTKRTTHKICYKSRKSDSTRYQILLCEGSVHATSKTNT